MRLTVVRGQSPFQIPRAAVLAGALLAILGVSAASLSGIESGPVACPFRVVTGLPCPTCGLTRTTHWLMRGDILRALATNPFDTIFLLLVVPAFAGMWVANRMGGFAVRISTTRTERRALVAGVSVLLLANWVYVLATQR